MPYRRLAGLLKKVGARVRTTGAMFSPAFSKAAPFWPLAVSAAATFMCWSLYSQGALFVSAYGDSAAYTAYFSPSVLGQTLHGYQSGLPFTLSILSSFSRDVSVLQNFLLILNFLSALTTAYALRNIVGNILSAVCAIALSCNVLNTIGMNNVLTEALSYQLSIIVFMGTMYLVQKQQISRALLAVFAIACIYFSETRSTNVAVVIVALVVLVVAHRRRTANLKKILIAFSAVIAIYGVHVGTVGNFSQSGNNLQRVLSAAGLGPEDADYFKRSGFDTLAEHLTRSGSPDRFEDRFEGGVWGAPYNAYMRRVTKYIIVDRPSLIAGAVGKNLQLFYKTELRPPYPEDPNRAMYTFMGEQQYEFIKLATIMTPMLVILLLIMRAINGILLVLVALSGAMFAAIAGPLFLLWSPVWWGDSERLFYFVLPYTVVFIAASAAALWQQLHGARLQELLARWSGDEPVLQPFAHRDTPEVARWKQENVR